MSKSESDPPGGARAGSRHLSLDHLLKVLTLVAAMAGVGRYFYDKVESADHERRARAISYIERYADATMLEARQMLYEFWVVQPDLVQVLRAEEISARSYRSMLQASVFRHNADLPIQKALLQLDSFYSQLSYCRSGELCDAGILDAYFCRSARKDAVAYAPFFARLHDRSGDLQLGSGLAEFAAACTP